MENILVGVTGGIAAYKTCELIRLLQKAGHNVKVIMTENAKKFVTPLTFSALTNGEVYDDLFPQSDDPMLHITMAKWADTIIIAPASTSVISKIATGSADDLLTTILLATEAKCYIAPSMNKVMWENPATQENIQKLHAYGSRIIMPNIGEQACGDIGPGRMAEPNEIVEQISNNIGILSGIKILITAGPTYEKIDPVRYLGNFSSGKMGYALASEAQKLGADVHLISGPVNLDKPYGCHVTHVSTAAEMYNAVSQYIASMDIFISAAAVSDFAPQTILKNKLKKTENNLMLELMKTQDILKTFSTQHNDVFTVGFCAETENLINNAKSKLDEKNLNVIIANQVTQDAYPFNHDSNTIHYITKEKTLSLGKDLKTNHAKKLLKEIYSDFKQLIKVV